VSHRVERFEPTHKVDEFLSGAVELDAWLREAAKQAEARDSARVYVIVDDSRRVLAYSALTVGVLSRASVSSRAAGGLSSNIPAVLLGKLAVDSSQQGSRYGSALLAHAVMTALSVRHAVGVRLLYADARDEVAAKWYESKKLKTASDGRTCYTRLSDWS
jgi:GNAT superfamily N-acetyltransferase